MKRLILLVTVPLLVYLAACTRDPKEIARKYVETGNKYYDRHQYKEASIMYRRALQKNMRDAQAHYRLGLVELRENMLGEARRSFLRATDIDHTNMDALTKLGEINLAIYAYDPITYKIYLNDVKDVVKKLLARDPKSYDGLRLSGFVAYADKDVPGAIEKFRAANAVKPDQPDLILALSRALYVNKQPEEAERTAKELISKHKEYGPIYDLLYSQYATSNRVADAEAVLKEKVANNPNSAVNLLQLAFHYSLTRRPDDMNAVLAKLTSDQKTFPTGHLLVGDFLMRIGQIDRALHEYEMGGKVDLKNKAAYGKRQAEALALEGKNTEAAQIVSQLLKENPKDTEVIGMHASMLVQSKDPKQIQKAIDELLPLIPATPTGQTGTLQMLHYNLGLAYKAKGDPSSLDQARLQFQETIKLNPVHAPAKLAMAELLLARSETTKAVQMIEEVLKLQPNNIKARLLHTMGLMTLGESQRARDELNLILKVIPSSSDARYQLAVLDLSEKHFKEAEAGFDLLLKAKDPRGLTGLVRSKLRQGDGVGAIQVARSQLNQTPDDLAVRRLLVETEFTFGRFQEALADFQPVLQKDPSAPNYVRHGELLRQNRQYDAAIESFKKAAKMLPNEPAPMLEMALAYDLSGRPEEARASYEQVLKLQPDNAAALNNLAYSMADQGVELDKALNYAERARAKIPNNLDVSDTIALIYLRKNQVVESEHLLSDLVSKNPNRATYHLHYATALYQKGDKSGARRELDAASRTKPSDKEKLQIEQLRQKLS